MLPMTRVLVPLALVVVLLAAAPAADAGSRKVPRAFYGVMWDRAAAEAPEADQEAQWALMARSGVESVRTVFSWAQAQPVAGEPPSFAATDRLVALAAAHRIRLLPVVLRTPSWAALYPGQPDSPPAYDSDYAAYLVALIGRYGPAGTFWDERPDLPKIPLRAWQVWNEPHLRSFWYVDGSDPDAWAEGYASLLRASHDAIRAADPRAKVVLAGLTDFAWKHLELLYDAGIRRAYDVAAINFFTARPKLVLKGLRFFRRALRRGHEPGKRVWLTETTWPASKGKAPGEHRASWQRAWETTDTGAAKRLRYFYSLAVRARRKLRLDRIYWYTWASSYSQGDLFDYAGLLHFDGSVFEEQPTLRSYAASARRHEGCRKGDDGKCR